MNKSSGDDELISCAYHEAGHAILALASNIAIPRLSILDNSCEVEEMDFPRAAGMDLELGLLRYFCFLIAGKEAERMSLIERGNEVDEARLAETAGVDYRLINDKETFLKEVQSPLAIDIAGLVQQARTFFADPAVWSSVQDLASRLLETTELFELEPQDYGVPPFNPVLQ